MQIDGLIVEDEALAQLKKITSLLENQAIINRNFSEMIKMLRERIEFLESKICN